MRVNDLKLPVVGEETEPWPGVEGTTVDEPLDGRGGGTADIAVEDDGLVEDHLGVDRRAGVVIDLWRHCERDVCHD